MENKKIVLLTVLLGLLGSCGRPALESEPDSTSTSKQISLQVEQLAQSDITIGKIEKQYLSEIVECSGLIKADPNNHAFVSSPMRAFIKKINVHLGERVTKGQMLAVLEHPNLVKIQQEYIEIKSQYDYLKQDFMRQGELSLEQAASLKTMQQAQNEFRKIEARLYSLSSQLSYLGINSDSIKVQNIQSWLALRSPISGYISAINANLGLLCPEEKTIFEIIGTSNLFLHLEIPENQSDRISPGQKIKFKSVANPAREYDARVKFVNHSLNANQKVNVHAILNSQNEILVPGMFLKAKILLHEDSTYAINRAGIISSSNKTILFVCDDSLNFSPREIKMGKTFGDWIEIIDISEDLVNEKVVTKGAYYLQATLLEEN